MTDSVTDAVAPVAPACAGPGSDESAPATCPETPATASQPPKLPSKKSGKKPPQRRSRHGLCAVMARVKVRGLHAIDRRTAAAQALIGWRNELVADLGGADAISAQQRTLVELAARTRLYVDHLDCFLMEQVSLVNAKRRSVYPVLRERQQLVDSLARILGQLGLERRRRDVPDLRAYVSSRYATNGKAGAPPETAPVAATIPKEPGGAAGNVG